MKIFYKPIHNLYCNCGAFFLPHRSIVPLFIGRVASLFAFGPVKRGHTLTAYAPPQWCKYPVAICDTHCYFQPLFKSVIKFTKNKKWTLLL